MFIFSVPVHVDASFLYIIASHGGCSESIVWLKKLLLYNCNKNTFNRLISYTFSISFFHYQLRNVYVVQNIAWWRTISCRNKTILRFPQQWNGQQ